MTLQQIADKLELRTFSGMENLEIEVKGGYVSDLLSDVMGNASEGEIWITLQSHINVIAVASLKDLAAIVLVNGIAPGPQLLEKAEEEGIVVLGTSEGTFSAAGKLYQILN